MLEDNATNQSQLHNRGQQYRKAFLHEKAIDLF